MITVILENKNDTSLSLEDRIDSPTWDEATFTWDEAESTWDRQSTLFTKEAKNSASLTLEPKI